MRDTLIENYEWAMQINPDKAITIRKQYERGFITFIEYNNRLNYIVRGWK